MKSTTLPTWEFFCPETTTFSGTTSSTTLRLSSWTCTSALTIFYRYGDMVTPSTLVLIVRYCVRADVKGRDIHEFGQSAISERFSDSEQFFPPPRTCCLASVERLTHRRAAQKLTKCPYRPHCQPQGTPEKDLVVGVYADSSTMGVNVTGNVFYKVCLGACRCTNCCFWVTSMVLSFARPGRRVDYFSNRRQRVFVRADIEQCVRRLLDPVQAE